MHFIKDRATERLVEFSHSKPIHTNNNILTENDTSTLNYIKQNGSYSTADDAFLLLRKIP